jgi:hypothetical protein
MHGTEAHGQQGTPELALAWPDCIRSSHFVHCLVKLLNSNIANLQWLRLVPKAYHAIAQHQSAPMWPDNTASSVNGGETGPKLHSNMEPSESIIAENT